MNAVRAGVRAAAETFNEKALIPDERLGWDTFAHRLTRYNLNDAYYNNTVYRDILVSAERHREARKLYKFVRGIYNPVARQVDLYVAKTYGGALDLETLTGGAVPLIGGNERLYAAIRQLWLWSNWAQQKSLYVRNGAKLGDTFLQVIDEPKKGKVRLEVLHPAKVRDVTVDAVDNVKAIVIEYLRTDPVTGRDYLYTKEIDGDRFATYRDDEPYAYFEDEQGQPVAEWPNPYGFVPVVLTRHKDVGLHFGASSFHSATPKIDELNDAASMLNDQVRKNVNVIWYMGGATKKDLKLDTEKDTLPLLSGPEGSQPFPMVASLNIADAGANLDRMLIEIERDMPELALYRIRESGNLTAPGVTAGYSDAIDRFIEARGNYDDGLVRAQMMAVSIGGYRGYTNFEGYTLDSYAAGDLEHWIGERPVIDDTLSKKERLDTLQAAGAPLWMILQEMGYPQDVIDRAMAEKEAQARNAARGFAEGYFGSQQDAEEDVRNGEETLTEEET